MSTSNPCGPISISDLELTAMIARKDVLATTHPVAEQTWVFHIGRWPGVPPPL